MERRRTNRKYKTHPLIKSLLALSLLLTAAVCAASYGFYTYIGAEGEHLDETKEMCAYEAYLSLCENILHGEDRAAADALSRCELFTGCGEADSLRRAILYGMTDAGIVDALELTDGVDTSERIAEAVRRADEVAERTVPRVLGESYDVGEWATLVVSAEVSEKEAHKTAAEAVGGGVTLKKSENHTFPLVYTFSCKNAAADVTRSGGRLLRMYVYRHGGAETHGRDACLGAAIAFLKKAGITDGVLTAESETDDGVDFVFCGSFTLDGDEVLCIDETVKVGVSRSGVGVRLFDASEYYKNKPVGYDGICVTFGRGDAANAIGVDESELSLVYTGGRLYWRFCGVKTLFADAENGGIRSQNP